MSSATESQALIFKSIGVDCAIRSVLVCSIIDRQKHHVRKFQKRPDKLCKKKK